MPFKSQLDSLDEVPSVHKRGPKKIDGRKTTTIRYDVEDDEEIAKRGYCNSKLIRMLVKKFLASSKGKDSKKITMVIDMVDDYLAS